MIFSVIIPCYNASQTLSRALDSLISQSFDEWEVICVDDCSSDNTAEIIRKYVEIYPKHVVPLQNDKNLGAGESRNRGIKISKGDYLCFLDADDYYDTSFFKVLSKQIKETQSDIVFYGFKQIIGKVVRNRPAIPYKTISDYMALIGGSFGGGVWRRSLWNNLTVPQISNAEDIALIPILVSRANVITTIDDLMYYYVYRTDSASSKHLPQVSYNFVKSFDYTLKQIDVSKYHDSIEFHGIKTIIYGATLNGIKARMTDGEIKKLWVDFEQSFPNWIHNKYIRNYSIFKRFFLSLAYRRYFVGLRCFVKMHELLLKLL